MADTNQRAVEVLQQIQKHLFLAGIQVGSRLVEQHYLRAHGKDSGQRRTLFLAKA